MSSSDSHFLKFGAGLVSALAARIEELRLADPMGAVTVSAPGYCSEFFVRRAMLERFPNGTFNVRFIRLARLSHELAFFSSSARALPPLNSLALGRIVRASLGREWGVAGSHVSSQSVFRRTFRDMTVLEKLCLRNMDTLRRRVSSRLWDSYSLYRRFTDATFSDEVDDVRLALQTVRTNDEAVSRLGRVIVMVTEPCLPHLLPLQDALRLLPCGETFFAVSGDENSDALSYGSTLPPHKPLLPLPDAETRFFSASDPVSEARSAVRNVVTLVRKGKRPGSIAILYNNSLYGERVSLALEETGIPFFLPNPRPLLRRPEGRLVLQFLELVSSQTPFDLFFEMLASYPFNNLRQSGGKGGDKRAGELPYALWKSFARKANLSRKPLSEWRGQLTLLNDAGSTLNSDELWRSFCLFVERFSRDATPPRGRSFGAWTNWLLSFLERYPNVPNHHEAQLRMEQLIARLKEISALDGLKKSPAFADMPSSEVISNVSLAYFREVVEEALSSVPNRDAAKGTEVFVGSIDDAAGALFETVFILGMSEGDFPRSSSGGSMFDNETRQDLDASGRFLPGKNEEALMNLRRFRLVLEAASVRFLYWPASSSAGGRPEVPPSPWFMEQFREMSGVPRLEARKMFDFPSGLERATSRLPPSELESSASAPEFDFAMTAALTSTSDEPQRAKIRRALVERLFPVASRGLRLKTDRRSANFTQYDGNLSNVEEFIKVVARHTSSTSRYEEYAKCPFRYFASYILNISDDPYGEDEMRLSPMLAGSLVHEVLYRFCKWRMEKHEFGKSPMHKEAQRAELHRTAWETFRETPSNIISVPVAVWEMEQRILLRSLDRWLDEDLLRLEQGWTPQDLEVEFGGLLKFNDDGEDLPVLTMVSPDIDTPLKITGRIDRIDASLDGRSFFVIDYKTGRISTYKNDPLQSGEALQLPVYAEAVLAMNDTAELDDVHYAYWRVSPIDGSVLQELRLSEVRDDLRNTLRILSEGIRSGLYPARPGKNDANCRFCKFDSVCPSGIERSIAWKRKSVNERSLHDYVRLKRDFELEE